MTAIAAAVREGPILMSGPMVRAIFDDRKTKTRRVIKPQPKVPPDLAEVLPAAWESGDVDVKCPYGQPGDRLWVRERHHILVNEPDSLELENYRPRRPWSAIVSYDTLRVGTPAIEEMREVERIPVAEWRDTFDNDHVVWRPSIHMPRWASRLTLEITDVRVERLREITPQDCIDEGIERPGLGLMATRDRFIDRYRELWDSLNAKRGYGWDVNPWVWVLSFQRVAA